MEQVNEKSDEKCVKILVGNKVDRPEVIIQRNRIGKYYINRHQNSQTNIT